MSFFTYMIETEDLFQNLNLNTNMGASDSDVSGFERTNAQTSDISQLWKMNPVTGGFSNEININLGAALSWDMIALINHDFDPSIQITIRASTIIFGIWTYTTTMTYRQFDMFMRSATTRVEQYIQITISDSISAVHGYSVGRVMIGLSTTLGSNFSYDWVRRRKKLNRSKRSELHARMTRKIARFFEFVFSFSELTDSQLSILDAFLDALEGDAVWTLMIPDPAVPDCYIVTLSSEIEDHIKRRHSIEGIVLTEETRGNRIAA